MTRLLGIDLGTSSVKAVLMDADSGIVLATAAQEYPIDTPAPGYAEQDPDEYWRATVTAVRQLVAQTGNADVRAVSFSGQMHGTVVLGHDLQPLHPAIIWADGRATQETARLLAAVPQWADIAGTSPASGFQITTLAWLMLHQSDLMARARYVILPKDYVRLKMTGEALTDQSDAASTGAFDVRQRVWSQRLLDAAGVPIALMPRVVESHAVVGEMSAQALMECGLQAPVLVVAGCADQPAQALGSGLVQTGMGSITIGTGGQVFIPYQPTGALVTDARLHVFNHAVPNMWYVLGAILSAGSSLRWLRNTLGLEHTPDAYALLSAEAAQTPVGASGLLFLPYLFGERSPHMDALASGVFVGLTYRHTRGHLARAVMEGVAFALRETVMLCRALGTEISSLVIAGGGSSSPLWRQILTDVLGVPLRRSQQSEQAGVGAALLAGVGAGIYADAASASLRLTHYDTPTIPQTQSIAQYDALYGHYTHLYPQLRTTMHQLRALSGE